MILLEKKTQHNPNRKSALTAKAHTTGGRDGGTSRSSDGRLDVKLSTPDASGTGTNPEQLLAAGWSACFVSSIKIVAARMKVMLPGDLAVDAEWAWAQPATLTSSKLASTSACRVWSAKSPKPLWTLRTARHVPIPTRHGATSRSRSTWCRQEGLLTCPLNPQLEANLEYTR